MIQEPTWPATELVAVTKSDSTVLNPAARLIYTGTGGATSRCKPQAERR